VTTRKVNRLADVAHPLRLKTLRPTLLWIETYKDHIPKYCLKMS
jgi:hypothetical protein